jgi:hypothetical protein
VMKMMRVLLVTEVWHGRTFQTVADRGEFLLMELGCRV